MRHVVRAICVVSCAIVGTASAAFAHVEFDPSTAAPGSVIDLVLFVEDEQPDAGTNRVELVFPEDTPVTLAAVPEVAGWVATPQGGSVGEPVTGVVWEGGPEPEDLELPIALGPLPTSPGRLQFKVLQTYDNGEIDRWIAEWPAGAGEPDNPGPVLDLVEGGPGEVPETSPDTTAAQTTTIGTPPTTAGDPGATAATAEPDDDDDGASPVLIVLIVVVVLGAIGGGVAVLRRRR